LHRASSTWGKEVRSVDRVQDPEPAGRDHRFAAAAAAVADEVDAGLDVLAELDEVAGVGLLEQVHPFDRVDPPGVVMADERVGRAPEGHADVLRRPAGTAHVLHLVAAIADAHAEVLSGLDHLAGAFVVEDVETSVGRRQRRAGRCRHPLLPSPLPRRG
jgi:hypothetical protein